MAVAPVADERPRWSTTPRHRCTRHNGVGAESPAPSEDTMTSATPPVDSPEPEADDTDEPAEGQQPSPPAPSSRPRLSWRLVVPVVTAAAGLMFAMSFQAAQGSDLRADRDLPQLIMDADATVSAKAARLDTLRSEVDSLSKTTAPSDRRLASLSERADSLAATAATTKVRGAALEVALDDAHRTVDSL